MYTPFKTCLVRAPFFSIDFLSSGSFVDKIKRMEVKEAIYIASCILYSELEKYVNGEIRDLDEKKRIESSLYRYVTRMSARCTPFGLFAGCSIGKLSEKNETCVILDGFERHTRLDMNFLCLLAQELSKKESVKKAIKYYPNSSLYRVGNRYRYVEYYYEKSRRIHQISSVEYSAFLNKILRDTRKGRKISELVDYLTNNSISENDAQEFVQDLIDSQIIISELTPSVTGYDFLSRILATLESANIREGVDPVLYSIQESLNQLDANRINSVDLYKKLTSELNKLKVPYDEKYLFQVDMTGRVVDATLGQDILQELQTTMSFLNCITLERQHEQLYQFRKAFYDRYEEREVPLMEVLDPELGIGYPVNSGVGTVSPLLDHFYIPGNQINNELNFQLDAFQTLLYKKNILALADKEYEIVFCDEDIKAFNSNWDNLPPTLYSKFEIIRSDNGPLIQLNGFYGASGANLLTRFAHTDGENLRWIKEIMRKEQELMPNVLLAEIVHLPDSRVGNILARPHLRDYEIMYLAYSDLPQEKLIHMSDLFLSFREGRLSLRSKKLNKTIIPRLTNAHNYRNKPMPVYQFLCDMQMQTGRMGLFFAWGKWSSEFRFLPRVRYRNTILSPAIWNIEISEMKYLFSIQDKYLLICECKKWRDSSLIPRFVLLADGDNELLIDWEDLLSINALFSIIKKRIKIIFKEFLFLSENAIVRDQLGNSYLNECVVAFYKQKKND